MPRSRRRSASATRYDRGERAQLNLGHTFAHALEAASGYAIPHGRAVALGLARGASPLGPRRAKRSRSESCSTGPGARRPRRAWEALARDKKAVAGRPRLVLLEAPGQASSSESSSGGRRSCARLSTPSSHRVTTVRIVVLNGVNLDAARHARPGGLRRASGSPSSRRRSTSGRSSSSARSAAVRRTTRASSSTGATRRTTGPTASSSIPARGRTTRGRSATRSSCSRCRSSRCTSRTSTSGRSGAGSRCSRTHRPRASSGKGPDGYREALEFLVRGAG